MNFVPQCIAMFSLHGDGILKFCFLSIFQNLYVFVSIDELVSLTIKMFIIWIMTLMIVLPLHIYFYKDVPPPYGSPAPQQGYPSHQQGYPSPQQGYPPPQQGYPPPQQGYPPPQQSYAPPQQQQQQVVNNTTVVMAGQPTIGE